MVSFAPFLRTVFHFSRENKRSNTVSMGKNRLPPQLPRARSKRRSGPKEKVPPLPCPFPSFLPVHSPHIFCALSANPPNSQGQSQPRGNPRQSHVGQTLQGRAIVPTRHRGHLGRSAQDQRQLGKAGAERLGGKGSDQEGGGAQQVEHLQYVFSFGFGKIWEERVKDREPPLSDCMPWNDGRETKCKMANLLLFLSLLST